MIEVLWKRLEAWGQSNAPDMLEDLNPGATDSEIATLSSSLGRELPERFLQSLKIHNGENDGWPCKVFADCGAYLSTTQIIEQWRQRQHITQENDGDDLEDLEGLISEGIIDVVGPVNPVMFSSDWVPIMDCNGDVFWAIDFAPRDGGTVGQIIRVDWEGLLWHVVSPSFEVFLEDYVRSLESGQYRIEGGLPTKEHA
jgi:cell wall assembly regulator SMI1